MRRAIGQWKTGTLVTGLVLSAGMGMCVPAQAQEVISRGKFKSVQLFKPKGDVRSFALLFSDGNGWGAEGPAAAAEVLLNTGAMVAAIDSGALIEALDKDGGTCVMPAGDIENLSRFVQGYARLPAYFPPVAVGVGTGASLAYALAAQAPEGSFSSVVSIGFCPELPLRTPLCQGKGAPFTKAQAEAKPVVAGAAASPPAPVDALRKTVLIPDVSMKTPWLVVQGTADKRCAPGATQSFVEKLPRSHWMTVKGADESLLSTPAGRSAFELSYRRMAAEVSVATLSGKGRVDVGDLPLVEVPAGGDGDLMAVLVSGDGGWAGIDKDLAALLSAEGVPVLGWDSLRYFWTKRTPQGFAADLSRAIRSYAAQWGKRRVLLIGYSQGADVLPFAVNRLPAADKAMVAQTVLLGLGPNAAFEFKMANWVKRADDGLPLPPEMAAMDGATTTCIYGLADRETICPSLPDAQATKVPLKGDHHFGGNYPLVASEILKSVTR